MQTAFHPPPTTPVSDPGLLRVPVFSRGVSAGTWAWDPTGARWRPGSRDQMLDPPRRACEIRLVGPPEAFVAREAKAGSGAGGLGLSSVEAGPPLPRLARARPPVPAAGPAEAPAGGRPEGGGEGTPRRARRPRCGAEGPGARHGAGRRAGPPSPASQGWARPGRARQGPQRGKRHFPRLESGTLGARRVGPLLGNPRTGTGCGGGGETRARASGVLGGTPRSALALRPWVLRTESPISPVTHASGPEKGPGPRVGPSEPATRPLLAGWPHSSLPPPASGPARGPRAAIGAGRGVVRPEVDVVGGRLHGGDTPTLPHRRGGDEACTSTDLGLKFFFGGLWVFHPHPPRVPESRFRDRDLRPKVVRDECLTQKMCHGDPPRRGPRGQASCLIGLFPVLPPEPPGRVTTVPVSSSNLGNRNRRRSGDRTGLIPLPHYYGYCLPSRDRK